MNGSRVPFIAGNWKMNKTVAESEAYIQALLPKVDSLVIGGGMAYTFLAAKGYGIGSSLVQQDQVDNTAQLLAEHGDKIDSGLKSEIEAALAEAKTAIDGGDVEAITAKSQALTDLAMKMGQAIYEKEQAASASPGGEGGEAASAGGEEVVDAEFSEVDEDNKG